MSLWIWDVKNVRKTIPKGNHNREVLFSSEFYSDSYIFNGSVQQIFLIK